MIEQTLKEIEAMRRGVFLFAPRMPPDVSEMVCKTDELIALAAYVRRFEGMMAAATAIYFDDDHVIGTTKTVNKKWSVWLVEKERIKNFNSALEAFEATEQTGEENKNDETADKDGAIKLPVRYTEKARQIVDALNNAEALKTVLAELVEAADVVVAIVDRKTDAVDRLKTALAKAKEILK